MLSAQDNLSNGIRMGVGRKLITYILLFSVVVTILGTALQLYFDYVNDIKSVKKTMLQIESSYLQSINSNLWISDTEQLELQLSGILQLPDIQFLEIIDNGQSLFSIGTPQEKNTIQQQFILSYQFDNKSISLGVLKATASLSGIYERLLDRFTLILISEAVNIFLVAIFIFIVFYALVGKHLVFMSDYTQHINLQHLDNPLKLNRQTPKTHDELEQLVGSINAMRQNLVHDMNKRKKVELELKHLNEELTLKNKELEQIIYVTSHDLRSPLVNVQGFSKELRMDCKEVTKILQNKDIPEDIKNEISPILQEDVPNSLQFILTSVSKMDSLLSGLLKLSRLGRASLDICPLNMNILLSNVLSTMEFQIKENNISVILDSLPECCGDENQIHQVFSNLLANAIKYMDKKRQGEIKISGIIEANQSIYSVADNGQGIAQKHQQIIFEIFHQLAPKENNGEGLGLNIVKKIMEIHRGKIWLESEQGKGSTFYLSLMAVDKGSNEHNK
jgi:signal transduction histidine kinase